MWWISFCSFRTKFGKWEDNCIAAAAAATAKPLLLLPLPLFFLLEVFFVTLLFGRKQRNI